MNNFEDGFAGWTVHPEIWHNATDFEFNKLAFEKYVELIDKMLDKLGEVLRLFEEYNLFQMSGLSLGDFDLDISESKQLKEIVMLQVVKYKDIRYSSLWLYGSTNIYNGGKLEAFNNIIRIGYEFFIDLISIDTFSDVWMPIDFEFEEINIDRGRINSCRLESLLMTIKSASFKVSPDEGVLFQDYAAEQVGFRMYYPKPLLRNIEPKYKDSIKGFFWEDF